MCGIIRSMNKYSKLKEGAIALRKNGSSYGEIRKTIRVSKSTLSLWLKDIPLSQKHRERLYTKQIQILSRGSQSQKERRKREIEKIIGRAVQEVPHPLSQDILKFFGSALYWAEGSKGSIMQITNSDPHLILFFVRWVYKIFNIPPKELKIRLNIYPQQKELNIKKFWSELTGIPIKRFGKSYVKPISTGYKKNNLYYGTARIEVPKSVDMKHKVFGWVQGILKETVVDVTLAQKKWKSLKETKRPVNL